MISSLLQERIDEMLLAGQEVKKHLDLSNPLDVYILERMAYYKKELPLLNSLKIDHVSEDFHNNCIIEIYQELKRQGRILNTPALKQ